MGPPRRSNTREYEDENPIAFAEIAVALVTLIWASKFHSLHTDFTLCVDSNAVYQ
jgi:hypothetical protein